MNKNTLYTWLSAVQPLAHPRAIQFAILILVLLASLIGAELASACDLAGGSCGV